MGKSNDAGGAPHEKFKAAVERSSFGTPEARKVRRYTNDVSAAKIVKRSQDFTNSRPRREG